MKSQKNWSAFETCSDQGRTGRNPIMHHTAEEVKRWYDGYQFGNVREDGEMLNRFCDALRMETRKM